MIVEYADMGENLIGQTLTAVHRDNEADDQMVGDHLLPVVITGFRDSYPPIMDGEHQVMVGTGEFTPKGFERMESAFDTDAPPIAKVLTISGTELGFNPGDSCEVDG